MNLRYLASLILGLWLAFGAQAQNTQKFGHVNTSALLEMMPDVATADKQLAAFQEGLIKGGESKARKFEQDVKAYQSAVAAGTLSKVQQAQTEQALTAARDEISQYEQQVQFQVMQKREELLKPILQKVDEAVQAEGKEGGYTFIFDSSVSGALLYAMDSEDLLPAVKQRLGLQ